MREVELSILVISHNQEKEIARCLDSIMAQQLSVSYEVIVSDDASKDKTLEIVDEYVKKYPGIIRVVHFDSNQYGATIGSEHCGLNKINAYRAAKGAFFVNIDGDDYLTCDTVYQEQLDLLKAHPECSMCRQEIMRCDNEHPEKGTWKWGEDFETGQIITSREYFEKDYFLSNPAFMIRRYEDFPPKDHLFCKLCNDEFITFWHLQKGDIVCLKRADYMYVAYAKSIDNSYDAQNNKLAKYSTSVMMYMHYFPRFSMLIYREYEVRFIHFLKEVTSRDLVLDEKMRSYLEQFDGFIFRYLVADKRSVWQKVKLRYIRYVALMMRVCGLTNETMICYLYRMLTTREWYKQIKLEKKI